jgi:hypothetical protein
MDYFAAIELAKQSMRELGKSPDEYHLGTVTLMGDANERLAGRITYKAYNQFLFLVNDSKYFGLSIIGDTGYFNSVQFVNNTSQEFTGFIEIERIGVEWSIEKITGFDTVQIPIDFVKVTMY